MKKCIAFVAVLLLTTVCAFAEDHVHVWGEWLPTQDNTQHSAVCVECGETLTTAHYNYSGSVSGGSIRVCGICGYADNTNGNFTMISDVTATPIRENPSSQRGELIVRGLANPTALDESIVYAFTINYANNGGLATFKNESEISISLDIDFPENWKLIRIRPSAGDDSVQNPEQKVDMEATFVDHVLTFTTRTPALYMIVAL